jgi:hypothetical protein
MTALGVVITSELLGLESLAQALNGTHPNLSRVWRQAPEWTLPESFRAQGAAVVALIRTNLKEYSSAIPAAAIAPFNALAAGLAHHYEAFPFGDTGRIAMVPLRRGRRIVPFLSGRHQLVDLIVSWVAHRHRARLKPCPQCARWFVDHTRNQAAQRCSRRCTIRFSNSRRPTKGGAR